MVLKILMIDDHPTMIEGYKSILSLNEQGYQFETVDAFSCKTAYDIITAIKPIAFDLVFLDYSMPPYPEQKLHTGEDIALLVKKHLPSSKIIMITAHLDAFKLHHIAHKINPEGMLVKSDFNPPDLLMAIEKIIKGGYYHSKTVTESLKVQLLAQGQLDSTDRQIITLLSEGYHDKSIAEMLQLSRSTIDKRKAKIKESLGMDKGNDEDIVKECRRLGLI